MSSPVDFGGAFEGVLKGFGEGCEAEFEPAGFGIEAVHLADESDEADIHFGAGKDADAGLFLFDGIVDDATEAGVELRPGGVEARAIELDMGELGSGGFRRRFSGHQGLTDGLVLVNEESLILELPWYVRQYFGEG